MKKFILIAMAIMLVLTAGCAEENAIEIELDDSAQQEPIGGQRDEHGCLGPAGYTWNESVNACVREWELNDNQKKAAKIAVEYVGYEKGLTVVGVDVFRCPGCFDVRLDTYGEQKTVSLLGWNVTKVEKGVSQ